MSHAKEETLIGPSPGSVTPRRRQRVSQSVEPSAGGTAEIPVLLSLPDLSPRPVPQRPLTQSGRVGTAGQVSKVDQAHDAAEAPRSGASSRESGNVAPQPTWTADERPKEGIWQQYRQPWRRDRTDQGWWSGIKVKPVLASLLIGVTAVVYFTRSPDSKSDSPQDSAVGRSDAPPEPDWPRVVGGTPAAGNAESLASFETNMAAPGQSSVPPQVPPPVSRPSDTPHAGPDWSSPRPGSNSQSRATHWGERDRVAHRTRQDAASSAPARQPTEPFTPTPLRPRDAVLPQDTAWQAGPSSPLPAYPDTGRQPYHQRRVAPSGPSRPADDTNSSGFRGAEPSPYGNVRGNYQGIDQAPTEYRP